MPCRREFRCLTIALQLNQTFGRWFCPRFGKCQKIRLVDDDGQERTKSHKGGTPRTAQGGSQLVDFGHRHRRTQTRIGSYRPRHQFSATNTKVKKHPTVPTSEADKAPEQKRHNHGNENSQRDPPIRFHKHTHTHKNRHTPTKAHITILSPCFSSQQ